MEPLQAILFAGVPDEEVKRALGQEELVGGVVDLLAAEVPDVDLKIAGLVGWKGPGVDLDPFRALDGLSVLFDVERRIGNLVGQAGLADLTLTDDQQLGL